MSMDHRAAAVRALARAGAPKADPTALAQWAEEHADQPKTGVVVNEDGQIVAQSITQGRDVKVRYVDKIMDPTIDPKGIIDTELGLAMGGIHRETGRPVIHLAQWEVCKRHDTAEDTHPSAPPTMWTPPGTVEPEDIYASGREDGSSMYE